MYLFVIFSIYSIHFYHYLILKHKRLGCLLVRMINNELIIS